MPNSEKLVLFDIDGTILKQWKPPIPSLSGILIKKHFNMVPEGSFSGNGMTDRQIIAERLKLLGIKEPEKDPRFEAAMEDYASVTKKMIDEYGLEPIPNVEVLIKRLVNVGVTIGLLTGNTPGRAKVKLETVNLWHYFKIGAFGQFSTKRSELVKIAMDDAKEKTGITFKKGDVFVLGDTVRDIQCAKESMVRSIGVATGWVPLNTLLEEKPDFAFNDFSDVEAMVKAILGG